MNRTKLYIAIVFLLGLLFGGFVNPAYGQRSDTLEVKPDEEIELKFKYDPASPDTFVAMQGIMRWPDTDGYAMMYVDGSGKVHQDFKDWLNVYNESRIEFHEMQYASAWNADSTTIGIADKATKIFKAKFIAPYVFDPIYVTVTLDFQIDEDSTTYSHEYVLYVNPNLGLSNDETPELPAIVSVYPTPTNGVLNVDVDPAQLGVSPSIRLYDIQGRVVMEVTGPAALSNQRWQLNLASGMYFVEVRGDHSRLYKPILILR